MVSKAEVVKWLNTAEDPLKRDYGEARYHNSGATELTRVGSNPTLSILGRCLVCPTLIKGDRKG